MCVLIPIVQYDVYANSYISVRFVYKFLYSLGRVTPMLAQSSYAHFCLRGPLPCRRSRGTRRAPSPQPAAHHHIPPNWKPAQWSRRAAFAMPAAGTGHVRTLQVSPGMTGTQYPSSPLAFSPARNNMMTPTHSAVTYPSLTLQGSALLRSEHSTADRRASSGRAQGGWRDTHAAGVVAQVVPIRATLHGYQHVENLLRQRTDESLAARHLDRPVQVWFLIHYMVFCHRVPVSPPRLPHPHPGVSCVDAGQVIWTGFFTI
jgi:hypothetical protein